MGSISCLQLLGGLPFPHGYPPASSPRASDERTPGPRTAFRLSLSREPTAHARQVGLESGRHHGLDSLFKDQRARRAHWLARRSQACGQLVNCFTTISGEEQPVFAPKTAQKTGTVLDRFQTALKRKSPVSLRHRALAARRDRGSARCHKRSGSAGELPAGNPHRSANRDSGRRFLSPPALGICIRLDLEKIMERTTLKTFVLGVTTPTRADPSYTP